MKADLIARLEAASQGWDEWRVQHPETGSYCMRFHRLDTSNPEMAARNWLDEHMSRYPDSKFVGYVVAKVRSYSQQDELIREAIEALKAKGATANTHEQMQPCNGDNCGSTDGRFHSLECCREHEALTGPDGSSEYTVTAVTARGDDAQAAPQILDTVEELAHRLCWRYKRSTDPAHSDTYTFNRTTLLEFALRLESRSCADAAPDQAAPAPLTDERRDDAIDAALKERGYPANTKNAGRAGWYAALRAHGIGVNP